jgi:hypothetical protein
MALPEQQVERIRVIENWMLATFEGGGIERFDDLHVDQIDKVWCSQQFWIEGALEAFRIAVEVRDRRRLPAEVGLGFSLQTRDQKTFAAGTDHRRESEKAVRAGHVFGDASAQELELNLFGPLANGEHCFYLEFRQKDSSEYNRTVFLQG